MKTEVTIMNKSMILEAAYETIKESLEWAGGSDDSTYGMYVDGIISMTETLLDKLIEPPKELDSLF